MPSSVMRTAATPVEMGMKSLATIHSITGTCKNQVMFTRGSCTEFTCSRPVSSFFDQSWTSFQETLTQELEPVEF